MDEELPLWNLFEHLRNSGLPLGINEYLALLDSLAAGFGTKDSESLARLCRTLWIKSNEEKQIFDAYFADFKPLLMRSSAASVVNPAVSSIQNDENTLEKDHITDSMESDPYPRANPSPTKNRFQRLQHAIDEITASRTHLNTTRRISGDDEYFPITRRQLKQSWRYLRRSIREGPATEFDVNATIRQISRHGVLASFAFRPRRNNRIHLLLLLDRDGSMSPFHLMSQRLAETALRGGRFSQVDIYYFHDCPINYLYRDSGNLNAEPIDLVVKKLRARNTVALIFSDAGSARGRYDAERLKSTEYFLKRVNEKARNIVWLNPVPEERWAGTTANALAQIVPMMTFNRSGMIDAINVLRGKPIAR